MAGKAEGRLEGNGAHQAEEPLPPQPERAALRRRWANLIRRVYEVRDFTGWLEVSLHHTAGKGNRFMEAKQHPRGTGEAGGPRT